MSVATHRAALAAMMSAVPNIGLVHDEEPYARGEAAFRALYAWAGPSGTELRGWWLRRIRTQERNGGLGRTVNAHTWELRGFMALDTTRGSGKAFDDLIEAVRRAYRLDPTLDGAAQPGPLDAAGGVQLLDSSPVVLSGTLCHGCRLQLTTYELLDADE